MSVMLLILVLGVAVDAIASRLWSALSGGAAVWARHDHVSRDAAGRRATMPRGRRRPRRVAQGRRTRRRGSGRDGHRAVGRPADLGTRSRGGAAAISRRRRRGLPACDHGHRRSGGERGRLRRCRVGWRVGELGRRHRALLVHAAGNSPRWSRHDRGVDRRSEPCVRVVVARPSARGASDRPRRCGASARGRASCVARQGREHRGPRLDRADRVAGAAACERHGVPRGCRPWRSRAARPCGRRGCSPKRTSSCTTRSRTLRSSTWSRRTSSASTSESVRAGPSRKSSSTTS